MFGLMYKVNKINRGGEAKLSRTEILKISVNLPNAKKNLPKAKFDEFRKIYRMIENDKDQRLIRSIELAVEIEYVRKAFDHLAPRSVFDGER